MVDPSSSLGISTIKKETNGDDIGIDAVWVWETERFIGQLNGNFNRNTEQVMYAAA